MTIVGALYTYPVKSCAGLSLNDSVLTGAGLAHDRSFMVIGPDGAFRSQRRDPRMALIRPDIDGDGGRLTLRAPGTDDLDVPVCLAAARRQVTLFGHPYLGIDQGDEPAAWLTSVLRVACRLVRVPPEQDRVTAGWIPGTAGYADSGAVHAISGATLDELNRRLGAARVPVSRFRPNIVIEGWTEPHLEDQVRSIVVGNAQLGFAKLAIRCAIPMVDQRTGTKAGPEPIRTLASYRRASSGGIAFGVKLSVLRPGKLTVGDELNVLSWAGSASGTLRRPGQRGGGSGSGRLWRKRMTESPFRQAVASLVRPSLRSNAAGLR